MGLFQAECLEKEELRGGGGWTRFGAGSCTSEVSPPAFPESTCQPGLNEVRRVKVYRSVWYTASAQ